MTHLKVDIYIEHIERKLPSGYPAWRVRKVLVDGRLKGRQAGGVMHTDFYTLYSTKDGRTIDLRVDDVGSNYSLRSKPRKKK